MKARAAASTIAVDNAPLLCFAEDAYASETLRIAIVCISGIVLIQVYSWNVGYARNMSPLCLILITNLYFGRILVILLHGAECSNRTKFTPTDY